MAQRPKIRLLIGQATALGPGKARLLEEILATGSISAAARNLGMSYRRAWLLADAINKSFKAPLIETATGGRGGGGAKVTRLGEDVLKRYLAMEEKAQAAIEADLADFAPLLAEGEG